MTSWQLQDAQNRLSELIDRTLAEGPQTITRHGVEVAVVIPFAKHEKLTAPPQPLGDFFLTSPLRHSDLNLERDPSLRQPEL